MIFQSGLRIERLLMPHVVNSEANFVLQKFPIPDFTFHAHLLNIV